MLDSYNPIIFSAKEQQRENEELQKILFTNYNNIKSSSEIRDIQQIIKHNISIMWNHHPQLTSNCRTLLIKASTYNAVKNDLVTSKDSGWSTTIDNLKIVNIDVDHFNMCLPTNHKKLLYTINKTFNFSNRNQTSHD